MIDSTNHTNKHVKFLDTHEELIDNIMATVGPSDYVFVSGKPLWAKYKHGLVVEVDHTDKTLVLLSRKKYTKVSLDETVHGIRIDQERVFTSQQGLVERYKLHIHPMGKSNTVEVFTDNPKGEYLKRTWPGDYTTVYSVPDAKRKKHMHYPVQGWLWSKDEENSSLEFIHPPRMDIQKFVCTDEMAGYGYYRKFVLQMK